MWKYALALMACLLGLQLLSFSQPGQKTGYDAAKIFTPDQLRRDFTLLTASIEKAHPAAYKFITPENWQALTAETSGKLTQGLTEEEFHILIRKYLMNLRCGHTTAMPSAAWYSYQRAAPKLLPLKVFLLRDTVYVKEALAADSVLTPGTEITSIQGVPATEILAQMRAIQQRDGCHNTFVNASVEDNFQTYFLFLFGGQDTYEIGYKNQLNQHGQVVVKGGAGKKKEAEVTSTPLAGEVNANSARYYKPNMEGNVAVLDIDGFMSGGYRKFYKKVFRQLNADKVEHLIIDVRDNGGGYFPNANFLLRHLLPSEFAFAMNRPKGKIKKDPHLKMGFYSKLTNSVFNLLPDRNKTDPNVNYALTYSPKKKNHYKGKVYVLTNGGTFSISSYTASLLKQKRDAVLVGEETGGGQASSNGILFNTLTLPETGIRVIIPYYELETLPGAANTGRGVLPNVAVVYTKDERILKKNKELEQAFQLINQGQ